MSWIRKPRWRLDLLKPCILLTTQVILPGVTLLGLKGAALAARGDKPGAFEAELLPLAASNDGVKLGESTFSRFFTLYSISQSYPQALQICIPNLSAWG